MLRLLREPAPSFANPIALLQACHERILQHCQLLERLNTRLKDQGVDSDLQQAAERVYRYFTLSGPAHHADEEKQLFPWLLAHKDLPTATRAIIAELMQQHSLLDAFWEPLASDLIQIRQDIFAENTLHMQPFIDLSRRHVRLENEKVFSVAAELLDTVTATALGAAMAERRRTENR
ncbi:hemerythrin domain-containing protein [Acidithiobacillus sp. IBUN Pt1247-S3]|uniref:hemerythrin domain-containing protein n=1 Tax=Acidithiobacillus sp. IBUN Pt1247-S3 TaxID=3166642 RepID=UPI0034E525D0